MKKIFCSLLMFICILIILSYHSFASTQLTTRIEKIGESEKETLYGGVEYEHTILKSYYSDPAMADNREVFTFTIPQDADGVKLATWSSSYPIRYTNVTLEGLAADYEKNHPGWIVIGGVNAEGFSGPNNEITNAFIQDGDVIRKDISGEAFKELIGWYSDGSHVVKRIPQTSEFPSLKIYAGNTIKNEFPVTKINSLPENDGISLLLDNFSGDLDLTNYHVFSSKYSLFRQSVYFPDYTVNGPNLGVFVKGTISEELSLNNMTSVDKGRFYLVTKNENVASMLTANTLVKCEYSFTDEYKDVLSMTGYMFKLIENNNVLTSSYYEDNSIDYQNGYTRSDDSFTYGAHAYTTANKQRSAIGFKKDGSTVLITENTGTGGPSQYEVAEYLSYLGCNEAYQFDSGGSTTFLKRNEFGGFKMMNQPADGTARALSTGLFIVTKDPGIRVTSVDRLTITASQKSTLDTSDITNIKAIVNGKEYAIDSFPYKITGLTEETNYEIYFTYETTSLKDPDKKITSRTTSYNYKTTGFIPFKSGLHVSNVTNNTISFQKDISDVSECIKNVYIYVNGKGSKMGDSYDYTLKRLAPNTPYEIYFSYKMIDPETNKEYTIQEEPFIITTLDFEPPTIKDFYISNINDNTVTFNLEIEDPIKKITKLYILLGEQVYQLQNDATFYTITINDVVEESYVFTLNLEYPGYNGNNIVKSEEVIATGLKNPEITTSPKKGCKKNLASLFVSLISLSVLFIWIKKKN